MPFRMTSRAIFVTRQRGIALLLLLMLVGVGALAVFVTGLNRATQQLERDRITNESLARAKEALIGYALTSETSSTETQPRPGNFPCPDNDAPGSSGYGIEDSTCVAGRIGRLPWKTLGLPELRDSSGEVLWYAVSGNFRRRSIASTSIINSDTKGTLQVYGADGSTLLTVPGSEGIAIVFAPGAPLGQDRSSSATANCPTTGTIVARNRCAVNYLENYSSSIGNAITNGPFYAGNLSGVFNDHLLVITTKDLMPALEPRVAKVVKTALQNYYSANGYYPFPAKYDVCGGVACASDATQRRGRLPLNAATATPVTVDWPGTFDLSWLFVNQWNQVIYYAVGNSYVSGGSGACPAGCLSVNATQNVAALFFMPGSPVGSVVRPTNSLPDYLEDTENRDGWGAGANDVYVTPTSVAHDRDRLYAIAIPALCPAQAAILISNVNGTENNCMSGGTVLQSCVDAANQLANCSCTADAQTFITAPCINNLNPAACQTAINHLQACSS